jgi:hypothetical protein
MVHPEEQSKHANWWCPVCGRPRLLCPSQLKDYIDKKRICRSCTGKYKPKGSEKK